MSNSTYPPEQGKRQIMGLEGVLISDEGEDSFKRSKGLLRGINVSYQSGGNRPPYPVLRVRNIDSGGPFSDPAAIVGNISRQRESNIPKSEKKLTKNSGGMQ